MNDIKRVGGSIKGVRKVTLLSMLLAIALSVYIIEAQVPVLFPGIKLGLANAVSLVVLLLIGWREALLIMFMRTLLGTMFGGNLSSFMFSIAGGLFSNIIMILMYKFLKEKISSASISVCGAICHNIAQLFVAALIVRDFKIYIYLPVLLSTAVFTGYFVGILTSFLCTRLKKTVECYSSKD